MKEAIDPWAEKLLVKAAEDEAVLQANGIPDAPFGFHAQQAAEKLLKALFCQLGLGLIAHTTSQYWLPDSKPLVNACQLFLWRCRT